VSQNVLSWKRNFTFYCSDAFFRLVSTFPPALKLKISLKPEMVLYMSEYVQGIFSTCIQSLTLIKPYPSPGIPKTTAPVAFDAVFFSTTVLRIFHLLSLTTYCNMIFLLSQRDECSLSSIQQLNVFPRKAQV
jgi:hypothetical protein